MDLVIDSDNAAEADRAPFDNEFCLSRKIVFLLVPRHNELDFFFCFFSDYHRRFL